MPRPRRTALDNARDELMREVAERGCELSRAEETEEDCKTKLREAGMARLSAHIALREATRALAAHDTRRRRR